MDIITHFNHHIPDNLCPDPPQSPLWCIQFATKHSAHRSGVIPTVQRLYLPADLLYIIIKLGYSESGLCPHSQSQRVVIGHLMHACH